MPINVYTGLMRSGKSYEVVSEVILPAIRSGRRVVTNVDGISEQRIHEYLKAKNASDDDSAYGRVVHVENAQVFDEKFFPYYDDAKGAHIDTTVQPGDLVCIDEAWRFWGATNKIHAHHKSFFLEHGHFTHDVTKVACDLVLMIQDMSTLNRFVKNVVAFNFRTHKKVSLGLNNTYSLNMWEGHKQTAATLIGNWVRRYNKDVFPLYSSFKGGAQGVMVNADKRQNVLTNKKLWLYVATLLIGGFLAFRYTWKFFHPDGAVLAPGAAVLTPKTPGAAPFDSSPKLDGPASTAVSDEWRITGAFFAKGQSWVVLSNLAGALRVASPSQFANDGVARAGEIDGSRVSQWSGAGRSSSSFGFRTSAAPAAPVTASK